jgi:hypothetical protein
VEEIMSTVLQELGHQSLLARNFIVPVRIQPFEQIKHIVIMILILDLRLLILILDLRLLVPRESTFAPTQWSLELCIDVFKRTIDTTTIDAVNTMVTC